MRVFDRVIHRGHVGAANDDGIRALADHLTHLLDLRRVIEVGLRNDDFLDQARLLILRQHIAHEAVHDRRAPGIACVVAGIADGPGWPLLRLEIAVGARPNRHQRIEILVARLEIGWQRADHAIRRVRRSAQSYQASRQQQAENYLPQATLPTLLMFSFLETPLACSPSPVEAPGHPVRHLLRLSGFKRRGMIRFQPANYRHRTITRYRPTVAGPRQSVNLEFRRARKTRTRPYADSPHQRHAAAHDKDMDESDRHVRTSENARGSA